MLTFAGRCWPTRSSPGRSARFVAGLAGTRGANSLGAKLVQLTMPGVPDMYQGCELAGLRLVDPDNRAPVDFARRRDLLAALDARGPAARPGPGPGRGQAAGHLAALRLRREHPDWFAGEYTPLAAEGPAARHAVGFARGGHAVTVATRLPGGPAARAAAGPAPCCPCRRRPLAGRADRCRPRGPAPAAGRSAATPAGGPARPGLTATQ